MKDYTVILQVEYSVSAKNETEAQERAEAIADSLKAAYSQLKRRKWMPEEIEITNTSVQE